MITENETYETTLGQQLMSDSKFYMGYSRWNEETQRYESWDEAVDRVMEMHREYYKDKMSDELAKAMDFAEKTYKKKKILGAQRALQFGGKQLLDKHVRNYNCSASYADRPLFFQEAFYVMLCGAGVGFSVQKQHVEKLPSVNKHKNKKVKIHVIEDSIEG